MDNKNDELAFIESFSVLLARCLLFYMRCLADNPTVLAEIALKLKEDDNV